MEREEGGGEREAGRVVGSESETGTTTGGSGSGQPAVIDRATGLLTKVLGRPTWRRLFPGLLLCPPSSPGIYERYIHDTICCAIYRYMTWICWTGVQIVVLPCPR